MPRLDAAVDQLRRQGYDVHTTTWGTQAVTIARRRFFRWRWLATALYVNTFQLHIEDLDYPTFASLLQRASDWTKAHHTGAPRGMQAGQVVVLVVHASKADAAALDFARRAWLTEFGHIKLAAIRLDDGTSIRPEGPRMVGRIYRSFLRDLLASMAG